MTALHKLLVHQMYRENELPILDKIYNTVNDDHDDDDNKLPSMSKSTLRRLLLEMGFKFLKRNRNSLLIP